MDMIWDCNSPAQSDMQNRVAYPGWVAPTLRTALDKIVAPSDAKYGIIIHCIISASNANCYAPKCEYNRATNARYA